MADFPDSDLSSLREIEWGLGFTCVDAALSEVGYAGWVVILADEVVVGAHYQGRNDGTGMTARQHQRCQSFTGRGG